VEGFGSLCTNIRYCANATVRIDEEHHTARTQGEFIDAGQSVVVLRWTAGDLVVEAVRE